MANTNKLHETLKAGIELYTGRLVESIQVHDDEKVEGSYAIRAVTLRKTLQGRPAVSKKTKVFDFILSAHWRMEHNRLTPELVAEFLEDAEFKTFPPPSGPLRFW